MVLNHRGNVLKEYELLCYQVAYYLLQQEEIAVHASLSALTELLYDDGFYTSSADMQKELVKKAVMRHSLQMSAGRPPTGGK